MDVQISIENHNLENVKENVSQVIQLDNQNYDVEIFRQIRFARTDFDKLGDILQKWRYTHKC